MNPYRILFLALQFCPAASVLLYSLLRLAGKTKPCSRRTSGKHTASIAGDNVLIRYSPAVALVSYVKTTYPSFIRRGQILCVVLLLCDYLLMLRCDRILLSTGHLHVPAGVHFLLLLTAFAACGALFTLSRYCSGSLAEVLSYIHSGCYSHLSLEQDTLTVYRNNTAVARCNVILPDDVSHPDTVCIGLNMYQMYHAVAFLEKGEDP